MWHRWLVVAVVACGADTGCWGWDDVELPVNSGSLGGQVVISGGVRGARVSVDQLDAHTGEVRIHIGEAVTDEMGRFAVDTGTANGILRVHVRGGTFDDLATGATIELDDTDEITSLIRYGLLDLQEDALVSPIGHLVEARTMVRLPVLGDMTAALEETTRSLHGHFGNVDWMSPVRLAPLDRPAISPTEPVRAAFVHAALSVLARDIAADAGAGPQEVNVYRLMQRWTEDLRGGTFDGNDGNDRTSGSGLQLGLCPPVDPSCVVPPTGCTTGQCRRLCDLYAGTPRTLLAGAMIKVIRDRGPGGINQTGLDLDNTISIVRAVSDNGDANLFDTPCIEVLDRLPPLLRFELPTPGETGFVRGTIQVKAVAVDDTDPRPHTSLVGFVDLDGDPGNAVALATIDTAALADGALTVIARATDLTGNTAMIERVLAIDNSAPIVATSAAGFFVDGNTWWTTSAAPVLAGTVTDAAPVAIKAVVSGGIEVTGAVAGTSWMILLPPGVVEATGTQVQIVAIDAAGNQRSVTQRLRVDLEAPVLSFQASTVNDEAAEVVTFDAADHSPLHAHTGPPIDLTTTTGCPAVTKFSYLLGSAGPAYAIENPGPNPIGYQLVTDDPGVGIATGSTQYRVGRRIGLSTTWILDWTSAGTGTPIATGVMRFPVGIFSDVVAGLATTEGTYDVELRATDRLGRTTTAARCFDLHLRAPPLEFEAPGARPTKDHAYSLDSLSLAPGAPFDQIAARLLNSDATGASLIDQDIINGTAETIFLTVTVTKPTQVMVAQSFVLGNATTAVTTPTCGDDCIAPSMQGPEFVSQMPAVSTEETTLVFPAKVFAVVAGVPTTEIPCIAPCPPSGNVFKFAIPPRVTGGQPARVFRVMTMIGQVSSLWPRDSVHLAFPPFFDDAITWTSTTGVTTTTRLTGIVDRTVVPERTGCVRFASSPTGPICIQQGTIVPYRALRAATLTFASTTKSRYEIAATATLPPAVAATDGVRDSVPANNWSTTEDTLP